MIDYSIKLYSGTSLPLLAKTVADKMNRQLGSVTLGKFSDGEIRVELERTVRGSHAAIIQSTCNPVNDNLMEILLMADALKRSSAKEITAVIPYLGYARQDRRANFSRTPISASVVASLLETAGVDHVITVDLHAMQIQGFFKIPVDNLTATHLFTADIWQKHGDSNEVIVVSPDAGGVARARAVAKDAGDLDLAIVDKRRPRANESEVMNIIGDVSGKTCVIVDDMIDTAGTLAKAANALKAAGATKVVAYATHGVFSGSAADNILNSALEEVVVTDTIPLPSAIEATGKVRQLSIACVISEALLRVEDNQSISRLFAAVQG